MPFKNNRLKRAVTLCIWRFSFEVYWRSGSNVSK